MYYLFLLFVCVCVSCFQPAGPVLRSSLNSYPLHSSSSSSSSSRLGGTGFLGADLCSNTHTHSQPSASPPADMRVHTQHTQDHAAAAPMDQRAEEEREEEANEEREKEANEGKEVEEVEKRGGRGRRRRSNRYRVTQYTSLRQRTPSNVQHACTHTHTHTHTTHTQPTPYTQHTHSAVLSLSSLFSLAFFHPTDDLKGEEQNTQCKGTNSCFCFPFFPSSPVFLSSPVFSLLLFSCPVLSDSVVFFCLACSVLFCYILPFLCLVVSSSCSPLLFFFSLCRHVSALRVCVCVFRRALRWQGCAAGTCRARTSPTNSTALPLSPCFLLFLVCCGRLSARLSVRAVSVSVCLCLLCGCVYACVCVFAHICTRSRLCVYSGWTAAALLRSANSNAGGHSCALLVCLFSLSLYLYISLALSLSRSLSLALSIRTLSYTYTCIHIYSLFFSFSLFFFSLSFSLCSFARPQQLPAFACPSSQRLC